MINTTYLFFGFASEYVLNPLFQFMKQLNFNCLELDLFRVQNPLDILQPLKNKSVVLINSAHLFFDQMNFATSYQYNGKVVSALEIIDYLKPIKNIYIPHDLGQLFHEKEMPWLNLFDYLLIPKQVPAELNFHSNVLNLGWIKRKYTPPPVTRDIANLAGFAFTDFEYYRRLGPEETYTIWKPLLSRNTSCKFPHWQGTDIFEDFFRSKGVNIFPSTADISTFIDRHGIILCHGESSVNTEAALAGRRTINILINQTISRQNKALGFLPNMNYLTLNETSHYLDQLKITPATHKELTPPQIKAFDFNQATNIIVSH